MKVSRYIVVVSRSGYLPESEPFVFECDPDIAPIPQVLEYVRSEVERAAPEIDQDDTDDWDALLTEIAADADKAADLDESGVLYYMPDGYGIEATRRTIGELIDLGYVPDISGIEACGSYVVDTEGSPLDFADADWYPIPAEYGEVVAAINFHAAYGRQS